MKYDKLSWPTFDSFIRLLFGGAMSPFARRCSSRRRFLVSEVVGMPGLLTNTLGAIDAIRGQKMHNLFKLKERGEKDWRKTYFHTFI